MYNVITSFGNYPSNIELGRPGPFTAEQLGLKWLEHCARFSKPGMLQKYRLVLLLPRDIKIEHTFDPYLDAWGERKRFDENSKVNQWPLGPNLCMQQILWLYVYKKLSGPFLWCEPDCIPVQPDWLDQLFDEYVSEGKPFLGAFVDQMNANGQHIPRHMTGNGIYPEDAFKLAPAMMEARNMPWDVQAAKQIMPHCYFTNKIQHEYRHQEILSQTDMYRTLHPGAVLFHTDKFGALIRILAGERIEAEKPVGKTLVEVFANEENKPEPPPHDIDYMLGTISEMCRLSPETKKKVAYFMLENRIVNQGHWAQYRIRSKKAKHVEIDQPVERALAT